MANLTETKEVYSAKVEAKLEKLNAQIDELKAKASQKKQSFQRSTMSSWKTYMLSATKLKPSLIN